MQGGGRRLSGIDFMGGFSPASSTSIARMRRPSVLSQSSVAMPLEGTSGPSGRRNSHVSLMSRKTGQASVDASGYLKSFGPHDSKNADANNADEFGSTESSNGPSSCIFPLTPASGVSVVNCLDCMRGIVDSKIFVVTVYALSVFVLFGDDLRLGYFEKGADASFNQAAIWSIALFTVEVVLKSLTQADYFLSFFFVLDIISTLSLILDITAVWEFLIGYEAFGSTRNSADTSQDGGVVGQSEAARAGRSSRVGTRAARVLRVFRLIRMVKILKLWTWLQRTKKSTKGTGPGEQAGDDDEEEISNESQVGKKLSERRTIEVILLVLAMLVMVPLLDPGSSETAMLSEAPQYGADVVGRAWSPDDGPGGYAACMASEECRWRRLEWERQVLLYVYFHNYYAHCPKNLEDGVECAADYLQKLCYFGYIDNNAGNWSDVLRLQDTTRDSIFFNDGRDWSRLQYFVGDLPGDIERRIMGPWEHNCHEPQATVYGVSLIRETLCPWKTFRLQEISWYLSSANSGDGQFVFFFDMRGQVQWEAKMNILRTVFIILVLVVSSLFFSADVDKMVLHPIERMIIKFQIIRTDPLYAIHLCNQTDPNHSSHELVRQRGPLGRFWLYVRSAAGFPPAEHSSRPKRSRSSSQKSSKDPRNQTLETKILENMIIKLGSLLAIGFGEAGSEIIGRNLADKKGSVDVQIPGRRVEAIYGFCRIRDFTVLTEVLQQRTMVFVNQVAAIVHQIVDSHLGAANKNLGEAFLLVWRLGVGDCSYVPDQVRIPDLSVMSFVEVVSAVNRDVQLATYQEHPVLVARLGGRYRVSLGFGLHLGWSIEGAIGSEFKIDASYLSSDVTMASSLEAATRQYALTILMSEAVVRACHVSFAQCFRPVDRVKFQGAKVPTRIFTVDLDPEALEPNRDVLRDKYKMQPHVVGHRNSRVSSGLSSDSPPEYQESWAHDTFCTNKYIQRMRAAYPLEFRQMFEKGYLNYEAGEWDVATMVFEETRGMLTFAAERKDPGSEGTADGPSVALLDFMSKFNYEAPAGWPGYRELLSREPLPVAPGTLLCRKSTRATTGANTATKSSSPRLPKPPDGGPPSLVIDV